MFRHFFYRWGVYIPPITDEAIFPDYRRGRLRIHAGWDNWVGYDFLSANDATDEFLRTFLRRHFLGSKDAAQQSAESDGRDLQPRGRQGST